MEILKDKKLLVGGLAVIGGIAIVAYLLKPKAPIKNSEVFYNAYGAYKPSSNPKDYSPNESCNLPDNFVRIISTKEKGIMKSYCARYDRIITMSPKGKIFLYRRQPDIPNATFINGNFVNSNGTVIITPPPITINSPDYEYAFINLSSCTV